MKKNPTFQLTSSCKTHDSWNTLIPTKKKKKNGWLKANKSNSKIKPLKIWQKQLQIIRYLELLNQNQNPFQPQIKLVKVLWRQKNLLSSERLRTKQSICSAMTLSANLNDLHVLFMINNTDIKIISVTISDEHRQRIIR